MEEKTLLHRQIHPIFVVEDKISVQAFENCKYQISSSSFAPSKKDNDQLSLYNGDKFSAKESYSHYTKEFQSFGVLSLEVAEVQSISDLKVQEDNYPYDGHCFIDFSNVPSGKQKSKRAVQLRDIAVKRNWTFKP